MSRTFLSLLLATFAFSSLADTVPSFEERVERARLVEQQPATRAYLQQNLFPAMSSSMSEAMMGCLAIAGSSRKKFTLITNITPAGTMSDVDYAPATNTAKCFAKAFRTLRLPKLPKLESGLMPIYLEMTLEE